MAESFGAIAVAITLESEQAATEIARFAGKVTGALAGIDRATSNWSDSLRRAAGFTRQLGAIGGGVSGVAGSIRGAARETSDYADELLTLADRLEDFTPPGRVGATVENPWPADSQNSDIATHTVENALFAAPSDPLPFVASLPPALDRVRREAERAGSAARELGLSMASAFEGAIVRGKSLRDVMQGLAQDVTQILARKLVTEPLAGFITAGLGNLGLPAFAEGGVVPMGLPELPGGGVLARLHPGELVLNRNQQAVLGRGGATISLTVNAASGMSRSDTRRTARHLLSELRAGLLSLDARGS